MRSTSGEDNFKAGVSLMEAGRRKEAIAELSEAYKKEMRAEVRLQIIDALLSALDPIHANQTLIDLTAEAIAIAEDIHQDEYRAHFMARRAEQLMTCQGFMQYEQQMIKLAPGWIEFSLLRDKQRYQAFAAARQANDHEINTLINYAMLIGQQKGREELLGFVLMSRGNLTSARYMELKGEYLRLESPIVKWLKSGWLRYYLFDHRFISSAEHRQELKALIASFRTDYLQAARLFEELQSSMAANAYYNLANHLRTAFRFREAMKCISKAEGIARTHNNVVVLRQVEVLKRIVKSKNKDIPNYVAGETRKRDKSGNIT
jgi:tetratricopeptide (TPR) repeat protein